VKYGIKYNNSDGIVYSSEPVRMNASFTVSEIRNTLAAVPEVVLNIFSCSLIIDDSCKNNIKVLFLNF